MTKYELLVDKAYRSGANVYELDLGVEIPCGKCVGNSLIINKNINTDEKLCILAEELGHFKTTVGNITDQTKIYNRKQEVKARAWGYNESIGLQGLIDAFNKGYTDAIDIANFLCVDLKFLNDAINYYKSKYGLKCKFENYTIFFSPTLQIVK